MKIFQPPQPGMWYVTLPHRSRLKVNLVGGPFATEGEARRWLAQASSTFQGGAVWQCPWPPSSPDPATADTH
jgi:hypothetical protein